jgi:hypothetical protein
MNNILKKYITLILNENIKNINHIEKLNVFDFDMTIYNPHEKTWNESVVNNIQTSINNSCCRTILCTARSEDNQIVQETEIILNQKNISLYKKGIFEFEFDKFYFKPLNIKSSVESYKSNVILNEINIYDIKEVNFFEDNVKNLQKIKEDLYKYEYINYNSYLINSENFS